MKVQEAQGNLHEVSGTNLQGQGWENHTLQLSVTLYIEKVFENLLVESFGERQK